MAKINNDQIEDIPTSKISDLGALGSLDTVGSAQIDDDSVTNAELENMVQARIKGRANSAGTGDPQNLSASQVRTILNVEDGSTADQTGAEIKAAYEAELDTNAFTDAEQTKLAATLIDDQESWQLGAGTVTGDFTLTGEILKHSNTDPKFIQRDSNGATNNKVTRFRTAGDSLYLERLEDDESTVVTEIFRHDISGDYLRLLKNGGTVNMVNADTVTVPDATADGEALAYDQASWQLGAGTLTGDLTSSGDVALTHADNPRVSLNDTDAATGSQVIQMINLNGQFQVRRRDDADSTTTVKFLKHSEASNTLDLTENAVVTVPDATADTHALNRQTADARYAKEYAEFYTTTGGVTGVSTTATTLVLGSTRVNSDSGVFTLATNEVTIDKTGDFKFSFDCYFNAGGTSRSEYSIWLERDGVEESGTRSAIYTRGYDSGHSASINCILSVVSGEVFRVRVVRTDGGATDGYQDDNGTRLVIEEK